jgi:hypothetical protein
MGDGKYENWNEDDSGSLHGHVTGRSRDVCWLRHSAFSIIAMPIVPNFQLIWIELAMDLFQFALEEIKRR